MSVVAPPGGIRPLPISARPVRQGRIRRLARLFFRWLRRRVQARRGRLAMWSLRHVDDRLLADFGLTDSEIATVAEARWWLGAAGMAKAPARRKRDG